MKIPREIKTAYPTTGTGYRQGKRIQRQIANFMLSVGSKGFRAPMTHEQAGITQRG